MLEEAQLVGGGSGAGNGLTGTITVNSDGSMTYTYNGLSATINLNSGGDWSTIFGYGNSGYGISGSYGNSGLGLSGHMDIDRNGYLTIYGSYGGGDWALSGQISGYGASGGILLWK